MSRGDDRPEGVPSNANLSQRMERLEANVEHVVDSVDRIEASVTEDHDELAARVEENEEKVQPVHTGYRVAKWALPIVTGMAGAGFALSPF